MRQTLAAYAGNPPLGDMASPHPDVFATFEKVLREQDLFAALRFLNGTTTYRFTGVYCFEPGLVKSLALTDRENPELRVGRDVPWFESYCTG